MKNVLAAVSAFMLLSGAAAAEAPACYAPRHIAATHRRHLALQHALYQKVHADKVGEAVALYRDNMSTTGLHDYELLRQLATSVICRCAKKDNRHLQRLALVSAAYSHDEALGYLFDEAFAGQDPLIQLLVITLMAQQHDPQLLETLRRAAASPIPPLQVEAVSMLADQGDKRAIRYVEAFLQKYPAELHCFFPSILAKINSYESHKMLRQLLHHSQKETVLEAIEAIKAARITVLLPYLKPLCSHGALEVREASLFCMALFGDTGALEPLQRCREAPQRELATVAKVGLALLKGDDCRQELYGEALRGNVWAIDGLALLPDGAPFLHRLNQSGELPLRLNSAIKLLEAKRQPTAASLYEVFAPPRDGSIWLESGSAGKALHCYKLLHTAALPDELQSAAQAISLRERRRWLSLLRETSEELFLKVCDYLVATRQADIVPAIFDLIASFPTEGGIAFAQQTLNYPGFPLLRHHSAIALAKCHHADGGTRPLLEALLRDHWHKSLLQFSEETPQPLALLAPQRSYELKATDEAQLMLEGLETLASIGDEGAVAFFLEGLQHGHIENQPLFAAMILRATI